MTGWVAGVDGCKAGWIVFLLPEVGSPEIKIVSNFTDIIEIKPAPGIVAIDMPIGLPRCLGPDGRGPEKAARAVLGRRSSSVFSVPSRSSIQMTDHLSACTEAAKTSIPPKRVSIQAFCLFPKIREVDAAMVPALEDRVYEVHPELAFWRLNGGVAMAHSKKTRSGEEERHAVLGRFGLPSAALTDAPKGSAIDDLLDAAASALIARRIVRGEAQSFPSAPERDAKGLRMAIWA